MATIKDVAEKAGVSITTVSRALNNKSYVETETRRKIFKAVKELNYIPNALGRNLKMMKTYNIGFLIPDIRNPMYAELTRSVTDAAMKKGYTALIKNTDEKENLCITGIESFIRLQVDGILISTGGIDIHTLKKLLPKEKRIPVVGLIRELSPKIDTVISDHIDAMDQVIDYLISKGHTRIACCKGPEENSAYKDRYSEYQLRMKELGLFDPDLIIEVDPYKEDDDGEYLSYKQIGQFIDKKIPFDAIIAANDINAMECLRQLNSRGIKVPDEVAVVGFDNLSVSRITTPAITTIDQPFYEMGKRAVDILVSKINDTRESDVTQLVKFKNQLIVRETT